MTFAWCNPHICKIVEDKRQPKCYAEMIPLVRCGVSCWFGWNSVGPISAKHGRILLKFGSFESFDQKTAARSLCLEAPRSCCLFYRAKTQQERTVPNQRNRFRLKMGSSDMSQNLNRVSRFSSQKNCSIEFPPCASFSIMADLTRGTAFAVSNALSTVLRYSLGDSTADDAMARGNLTEFYSLGRQVG